MGANEAVQSVNVVRVDGGGRARRESDRVAIERALEVRLNGRPFSVIMRTPGDDEALARGFLFSEGIVQAAGDIDEVVAGTDADVVDVHLSVDRMPALDEILAGRRNVAMNSSCGMCGRTSRDAIEIDGVPLPVNWTVPAAIVAALPGRLAGAQPAFAETGGLHAAGLFRLDGSLEASAEDVGRHNAVDKLVGRMIAAGRLPLAHSLLGVSGRLSFEIVQKAWLAGVPLVAAVSAPSSLAVDLAARCGMTLAGFVRDGRFNVYAGAARIATTAPGEEEPITPADEPAR